MKMDSMQVDVVHWRDVFVRVMALEPAGRLHPADVGVEGRYKVAVPSCLEDGAAAAAALDAFHSTVPVKALEALDITVMDEAGRVLACSPVDAAGSAGFKPAEVRKQPSLRKDAWWDLNPPTGLVLTLTPEHARVVNSALVEFMCATAPDDSDPEIAAERRAATEVLEVLDPIVGYRPKF